MAKTTTKSRASDAEQERLAALDRYDVLDTPPEESFDRITRLAKTVRHTFVTERARVGYGYFDGKQMAVSGNAAYLASGTVIARIDRKKYAEISRQRQSMDSMIKSGLRITGGIPITLIGRAL